MTDHARPVEILLVQDDSTDEILVREDFAMHKVANRVSAVRDVSSAMACLHGAAPYTEALTPDLVLLDLNLPWPGGGVFLEHLRSRSATADIPVILLVDSIAAEEIVRRMDLPVQGYAPKPVDFACLVSAVCAVAGLGFEIRRPARYLS
ncbi:response regulator [Actinoplanes sp. NPDC026619]|uniref:response regulator n=1 Tax=Actinoplanes sp. NPDC026619 TaxID=3155798 RepID=UPI0033ED0EAD